MIVRDIKLLLFYVCRLMGLFKLAQWLTRDRLKILCYHGFAIADEAEFRPKLFIRPERFEQRLAAIRSSGFCALSLDEAVTRLYLRTLPANALVITIDDGFHSVYRLAVPQLKSHGYPAAVYVTTYYVENPNPIFGLVVQYMFWKTRKRTLVLKNVPWSADRTVDLSDAAAKEEAMQDCIRFGERECTEPGRVSLCKLLGELLGTTYEEIHRSKKFHLMTPGELGSLEAANVEVELHTHRHSFPNDNQLLAQREIAENREALERWVASHPRHFCYPSGLWEQHQWSWLDSMQVKSSTTCIPGLNSHATPRHALHRFLDGENIHQLEFEAALSGFSDLLRGLRFRRA